MDTQDRQDGNGISRPHRLVTRKALLEYTKAASLVDVDLAISRSLFEHGNHSACQTFAPTKQLEALPLSGKALSRMVDN